MRRKENPVVRSRSRGNPDSYNHDLAKLANVSLISKRQESTLNKKTKKDRDYFLREKLSIKPPERDENAKNRYVLHSNRYATGSRSVEKFMAREAHEISKQD